MEVWVQVRTDIRAIRADILADLCKSLLTRDSMRSVAQQSTPLSLG